MPLTMADLNTNYKIVRIAGRPDVRKHLEDLGFTVGSDIRLISVLNGNVIVSVRETRVALNEDLARKIYV